MSDNANSEGASIETDKPAPESIDAKFPPFPDPTDNDFEDDVPEEERNYYKTKFPDLNTVKFMRLHCTACDRHLGSSARNIGRMRAHPMLRTLVCHTCHTFYNSGEFEKGDDGSELYCRWCGQGGQVYCCSNCPHVFCAKCIKRNLGPAKIKEIETTDDWKCFKCNPDSLKEIRAVCWALLRYCDLKNEMTYKTEDPQLKEIFQKECSQDYTDCCKHKNRRREKPDVKKKEEKKVADKTAATIISKMPSTIQVKKFASINVDDTQKNDKKPIKRAASPKQKPLLIKNPMSMPGTPRLLNPIAYPPPAKKIKMLNNVVNPAVKFNEKFVSPFNRIRPRTIGPQLSNVNNFNGFNNQRVYSNVQNMVVNDNINLSLESLTQGLDMATVAAMSNNANSPNDDVVCTPDFPMEPVCEVTEDNDDDVECITPSPINTIKINNPPPIIPRSTTIPEISNDNIVQMTENDVTVNTATGGLKFRVDPQTLSSNKMYRLPDGRVFAINANPSMPGGYSATIVAVTESAGKIVVPQGLTYSAKLSAVPNPNTSTPVNQNPPRETRSTTSAKRNMSKHKTSRRCSNSRECDLNVPVEWYRHNLIDAVDALEFSLSRLHKLKKDTNTMYLRTRTIGEMRNLHRNLERLLNTSSKRFLEIKESLNKEMKQYVTRKMGGTVSDDDDDVEILPDLENDDPIFIDENSIDSNVIEHESSEIDLTGVASGELNDSGEKDVRISHNLSDSVNNSISEINIKSFNNDEKENDNKTESNDTRSVEHKNEDIRTDITSEELICAEIMQDNISSIDKTNKIKKISLVPGQTDSLEILNIGDKIADNDNKIANNDYNIAVKVEKNPDIEEKSADKKESISQNNETVQDYEENISQNEKKIQDNDEKSPHNDNKIQEKEKNVGKGEQIPGNNEKLQDSEISDELIENLLKDDNDADNTANLISSEDIELKEI